MSEPLLKVQDLTVAYRRAGREIAVTDAVHFSVGKGEVFALVGESGCGKSATALAIPRLLPCPSGRILSGRVELSGRDLSALSPRDMVQVRGKEIGMIFQEPTQALDPVRTVGSQLAECHGYSLEKATQLLREVGLSDPVRVLRSHGHQLSGGMAQRVCIAMALLPEPSLVIADEPTTALDATVQAAVMDVLLALVRSRGAALLLITHNMDLVAQYADRIAVMYAGRIVESGLTGAVLQSPRHPYSRALLAATPRPGKTLRDLVPIPGVVPRPEEFKVGCRFAGRCAFCQDSCLQDRPPMRTEDGHHWLCVLEGGA